jgi:hypothetical protein
MITIKNILFALALTFLISQTLAQLNHPVEKGYVILPHGDTLTGFIYNERNKNLFKKVRFQVFPNAPVKYYDPSSAKAFYLADSKQLFISGKFLSKGKFASIEQVFLKVLVKGPANLYFDVNRKTRYYVTKGEIVEAIDKGSKVKRQIGNAYYTVETKPYEKTLQTLLSDCLKDTLSFSFTSYELIKVIERYNVCKGVPSFKSGNTKSKVFIGFSAGLLRSALSFEDKNAIVEPYGFPKPAPLGTYDLTPLSKTNLNSGAFFGGLSISVYPGSNKHLSLTSLIAYTQRKWSAIPVKLDLKYIDIPVSIAYNINIRRTVQPVIGVGLNLAVNLNSMKSEEDFTWSFYRKYARRNGDTYPDVMMVPMPVIFAKEFKPTILFPFASAGLAFNNKRSIISLNYRTGLGGSITKSPLYNSQVTNHLFFINYTPIKMN